MKPSLDHSRLLEMLSQISTFLFKFPVKSRGGKKQEMPPFSLFPDISCQVLISTATVYARKTSGTFHMPTQQFKGEDAHPMSAFPSSTYLTMLMEI